MVGYVVPVLADNPLAYSLVLVSLHSLVLVSLQISGAGRHTVVTLILIPLKWLPRGCWNTVFVWLFVAIKPGKLYSTFKKIPAGILLWLFLYFFISFFLGRQRPNLITRLSGWRSSDWPLSNLKHKNSFLKTVSLKKRFCDLESRSEQDFEPRT